MSYMQDIRVTYALREGLYQYDGQTLEPVQPENQLFCKADEIGSVLQTMGVTELLGGASSSEVASIGEMLKSLSQINIIVRVEKETVDYSLEVQGH